MLWSNVHVHVYSYKNNFIINIAAEFIEKDDYVYVRFKIWNGILVLFD